MPRSGPRIFILKFMKKIIIKIAGTGAALALLTTAIAFAAWNTPARLRCDRGVSAQVTVTLTRDGRPIAQEIVKCGPGPDDTGRFNIASDEKPNDWHVDMTVTSPNGTNNCVDAGTSFPARIRCTTSPQGATIQLGHSKETSIISLEDE